MSWLARRTQRTELLVTASLLAVLTAALLPFGLQMASAYSSDELASCGGANQPAWCDASVHSFLNRFESIGGTIGWLTLVPGLIGVLLAAPAILDVEHGTFRLAWTQSISRGRWIAVKLGSAAAVALVAAGGLIWLLTWWGGPLDQLRGRMEAAAFDSQGTVGFGYALFALGLALTVGVVWRRAAPAIVVTFAAYVGARVFVDVFLRNRLVSPDKATWSFAKPGPDLSRALVLNEYPSDRLGRHVELVVRGNIPCLHGGSVSKVAIADPSCLAKHGAGFTTAVFEPASRFWELQGIETALFGGAGVLLIAFAAWWLHERTT